MKTSIFSLMSYVAYVFLSVGFGVGIGLTCYGMSLSEFLKKIPMGTAAMAATYEFLRIKETEIVLSGTNTSSVSAPEMLEPVEPAIISERSALSQPLKRGYYILPSGQEVAVTGHMQVPKTGLRRAAVKFFEKGLGHASSEATEACNAPLSGEPRTYWREKPDKTPRIINICVWIRS